MADTKPTCGGTTKKGRPCTRRARADGFCCDGHRDGHSADGGRGTKLTDEVVRRLCKAIEIGAHYEQAAQHAGISVSTFYSWKRQAEGENAPLELLQFLDAVKSAEAACEINALKTIQSAIQTTWLHSPYCETHFEESGKRACSMIDWKTEGYGDDAEQVPHPENAGCRAVGASWQAAMTLLERRHPARWRRREVIEHEGGGTAQEHEFRFDEATRDAIRGLLQGRAPAREE